jgi:GTP-binding protein
MPGVTRDPVEAYGEIESKHLMFVDTGGYRLEKEPLGEVITERSLHAIEESDLVLLVIDVGELTPEDEEFIEKLRPYSAKIILVVNKIDSPEREDLVWDYYRFGFQAVVGISAVHGRNFDSLREMIVERIGEAANGTESLESEEDIIRVAILGKPNTGKSTLLNLLTDSDQSIVSEIPGTTRDVIEGRFRFDGRDFTILDTGGIRKKKKITQDVEYYSVNRAIHTIKSSDLVFLLIDSPEGLTTQDKKITDQIIKHGRGVILVLSKWDAMPEVTNLYNAVKDKIRFFFPVLHFAPIVRISAHQHFGVNKLLRTAVNVYRQLNRRIETPVINRKLEEWKLQYQPPSDGKIRYKIRYITQVSANPVKFVAFVNRKENFPQAYITFIKNRIREDLGFDSVPIALTIREKKR